MNKAVRIFLSLCVLMPVPFVANSADLAEKVMQLRRDTVWEPAGETAIQFPTFHPQGMVKIGDYFFVSSVEVIKPPTKFAAQKGGYDRDTGEGRGHLFKISQDGRLLGDAVLGEGPIYHPGGIDFDGKYIWVPVAEYRPDSNSIVYRVDPETLMAKEVFRYRDHIGGIVHDLDNKKLIGLNWASIWFYTWPLGENGEVSNAHVEPAKLRIPNPAQYFDFQDCHFVGATKMLCSGRLNAAPLRLGGLELISLDDYRPVWQVPVDLKAPSGRPMTLNPVYIESVEQGLRAWFMPDDDKSILYVYDVELTP